MWQQYQQTLSDRGITIDNDLNITDDEDMGENEGGMDIDMSGNEDGLDD